MTMFELITDLEDNLRPKVSLLRTLSLMFSDRTSIELDADQCVSLENAILDLSKSFREFEQKLDQHYQMIK